MIRGQIIDVNFPPVLSRDLSPSETFAPNTIRLSNGLLDRAGYWTKRPGLTRWRTLERNAVLLIPYGDSFAVDWTGKVWVLTPTVERVGNISVVGTKAPTWINFAGDIIIARGSSPMRLKTEQRELEVLPGNPPAGHLIATVNSTVLLAGHAGLTFRWSAVENAESWPEENENYLIDEGQFLKAMRVYERELFFWTDRTIEVWRNIGGASPFVRNLVIEKGTLSGESVVQANNTFYWLGGDGLFYVLNGNQPQVIPTRIPTQMRDRLLEVKNPESVRGFDFVIDGCIRWIAPKEGICFVYDYKNDFFSEDYLWRQGTERRLPLSAAMQIGNQAYVADDETGEIWKWDYDADADTDGLGEEHPIRVERVFTIRMPDQNYARVNRMRLRLERGRGRVTSPAPKLLFRWCLDQGPYCLPEELDLGARGEVSPFIDIYNLGLCREMTIHMVETDAANFLLTGAFVAAETLGI